MVVEGFQGVTGGGAQLERKYLPAGMGMGEDTRTITAEGSGDDEITKEVINHFVTQQTKYNIPFYFDSDVPAGEHAVQTDWDPWAFGHNLNDVRAAWFALMVGQLVDATTTRYITRIGSELFYHRFAVKMARTNYYELYNEHGTYRQSVRFEGHLEFDGDISTTVTSAAIEAVVQTAPPIILTGSAAIDQALTTDIKIVDQDQAEGG
jgi:hypothetical protein